MLSQFLFVCRAFFFLTTLIGFVSILFAKFRNPTLLKYGKTRQFPNRSAQGIISFFEQLTVPKAWFRHFYIFSELLAFISVLKRRDTVSLLFLFHSTRRLMETFYVNKFGSQSRMHVTHYLVGIWFYSGVNFGIAINQSQGSRSTILRLVAFLLFAAASYDQFQNHLHLAQLKKYSLPTYGMFKVVCSPHFLDEAAIYLALAILSGSTELIMCFLWTIFNLSVSAVETRTWYLNKFSKSTPQYAIIPFVL
ncbi:LAMI_0G12024g1_1 [Lachancea mirantina]|uniref:Polyprenal reductase n=1 Tax=Lachancea mirantina TaxID=1230905 RepID=A0A1G4KB83_9SACH|nr:LAMI_0G12024g1_1 [Lachancea mirantina]